MGLLSRMTTSAQDEMADRRMAVEEAKAQAFATNARANMIQNTADARYTNTQNSLLQNAAKTGSGLSPSGIGQLQGAPPPISIATQSQRDLANPDSLTPAFGSATDTQKYLGLPSLGDTYKNNKITVGMPDDLFADRNRFGFAKGTARVPGKGDGSKDTVPAKLAPGEAVLNKPAADMAGRGLIAVLNKMGAQKMGMA